jgi:4-amino-4-deoxy-L-arabinose transferase-like glycosyltransferase
VLVLGLAWGFGLFRWPVISFLSNHEDGVAFARLLVWFSWPAWPLVLWSLWQWRQQWQSGHVLQPLIVITVMLIAAAMGAQRDRALLLALPAMATLAAFALPTLRRSLSALVDWFTLLFFSACALLIWVVWLAMQTGWPAKTAANVDRLAPGFEAPFSWILLVPAVLATAAWLALLAWRVGRHTPVLWKSMVLPAAGATMSWLLLMTLWLPLIDHGMSHGPQSRAVLASLTSPERCVLIDGLPNAQIHALRTHTPLALQRNPGKLVPNDCANLLTSPQGHSTLHQRMDLSQWTYLSTVKRLGRTRDDILIYSRNPVASR